MEQKSKSQNRLLFELINAYYKYSDLFDSGDLDGANSAYKDVEVLMKRMSMTGVKVEKRDNGIFVG